MSYGQDDELKVQGDGTENEDEGYVEYDIASYPSDLTLSGINDSWLNGDICIPQFQREFVWTINQASLLVESFLLGLPVPPVFFYIGKDNKYLVIDGHQRIRSITFFLNGYFGAENIQGKQQVFRLAGLNDKSPFQGKTYDDLTEIHQRKFKSAVLRAINIRQLTPNDESSSMYHIFERLNTGGTPLKPQEIRNCVYRGKIVEILRDLNNDPNWRLIIGNKYIDKHQKDIELVLRALSLFNNTDNYQKPMKEFLNENMKFNQKGTTSKLDTFINIFPETTKAIVEQLGKKPFHVRGPLNASVLDTVFTIALENPSKINEDFKRKYDALKQDVTFTKLTQFGTTDTSTVKQRYKLAMDNLIA